MPDASNLLLDVDLFVVELNEVVLSDIVHQVCYLAFKVVHAVSQLIFLPKVLVPCLIQGVIVDFKEVFDALLVMVKLLNHLLLLGDIRVLELDDILLDLLANISQDNIVMPLVFMTAKLAVESFINLAAVLYLSVLVVLAKESLRVI